MQQEFFLTSSSNWLLRKKNVNARLGTQSHTPYFQMPWIERGVFIKSKGMA